MTVASELNRKTYAGNGVTTSFATTPVVFFDTGDLDVYVTNDDGTNELLVENTDYTVSGGSGSTGTVSLAGGSAPYGAPAADETVVIVRDLDVVQEFDPENNDSADAEALEQALDKIVMMLQQVQAQIGRVVRLSDADVSDADLELPTPEADKLIGWNAAADGLTNIAAADVNLSTVTAFAESLLAATTAAVARTTLDAQQDVFTTRGDVVTAGVSAVAQRLALGTSGKVLTSDGTDVVWSPAQGGSSLAASVGVTSGTSVLVATGVASTVVGLDIDLRAVSTNGVSALRLNLGTAGGIDASGGYVVQYASATSGTETDANNTSAAGFLLMSVAATSTDTHYGKIKLRLVEASTNTWSIEWIIGAITRSTVSIGAGQKALSGALTQVSLTTSGGTDAFDGAGSALVRTYS